MTCDILEDHATFLLVFACFFGWYSSSPPTHCRCRLWMDPCLVVLPSFAHISTVNSENTEQNGEGGLPFWHLGRGEGDVHLRLRWLLPARSSWTSLASEAKMILIIASETKRKQGYVRKKNKKMSSEMLPNVPMSYDWLWLFFRFSKSSTGQWVRAASTALLPAPSNE